MLHAKFRGNRSAGYGEEDFWRVFTIYGRGGSGELIIQLFPSTQTKRKLLSNRTTSKR